MTTGEYASVSSIFGVGADVSGYLEGMSYAGLQCFVLSANTMCNRTLVCAEDASVVAVIGFKI